MVDQKAELVISRGELKEIVETRVEIPDETLFKSIQRVLEVRGGERWRDLDEIQLHTPKGILVFVSWREKDDELPEFPWDTTDISTEDVDGHGKNYEVRYFPEEERYELVKIDDLDARTGESVSNTDSGPNLCSARLLSVLSDAHMNTPLEPLENLLFSD